ncbi:hypothetical protein RI129_004809 [Pyrocoelia pectoralis]|uniref:CRAL-TRIO domain-containing protein n=1 Tax=Pyrocoelia pectoralis TaxID=417401 RepID=A0AAN7VD16_9COLE
MAIRKLCPELQEVAEKELFETPERIQDDLNHLREWLSKQPHLKVRSDDQSLITFLRGCKFSLQRAQEKLDYFYTSKTLLTEFFSKRDPYNPDIQEVLKYGAILPLPNTASPGGPRILLHRMGNLNADKVPYHLFQKVHFMIMDILMQEDDNCVVSGFEIWSLAKNVTIRYVAQWTPAVMKRINSVVEKGYPLRIKNVYSTHCPSILESVYNLYKSLASDKIGKRMYLYGEENMDKFCERVPKRLHPTDFGGNNGSFEELTEFWKKKVESYRNWFLQDEEYGTREDLRVGIPKTSDNLFGVEGTFRKLTVD